MARNTSVATGTNISKRHTWIALLKTESVFTHAFTPTPTCAPSRSTLYTGLYPARHGAMGNHTECHAHLKALPSTLRKFGYRVAIAGKTHVKPETLFDFEYIGGFLPKRAEHKRKYRAEGLDTVPVERFLSSPPARKSRSTNLSHSWR